MLTFIHNFFLLGFITIFSNIKIMQNLIIIANCTYELNILKLICLHVPFYFCSMTLCFTCKPACSWTFLHTYMSISFCRNIINWNLSYVQQSNCSFLIDSLSDNVFDAWHALSKLLKIALKSRKIDDSLFVHKWNRHEII